MSCGVDRRHGSDPELLWLWRRPVVTAPIRPLAAGAALKRQKTKQNKIKDLAPIKRFPHYNFLFFFFFFFFFFLFSISWAAPKAYGGSQASRVELELQLPSCATATATATQDPSRNL